MCHVRWHYLSWTPFECFLPFEGLMLTCFVMLAHELSMVHISKSKSCCSVHHNVSSSLRVIQHGSVGELGFTHLLPQPCLVCNLWPTPHTDLSWLSWRSQHASEWFLQVYDDVAKLELHDIRLPSVHGSNVWNQ